MGLYNFRYSLREALHHFRRNLGTCLGAVITIFLSLFIIGTFVLGSTILSNIIGNVENQVTIQAFLSDDATQDQVKDFEKKIKSWDSVDSVKYKDKDEALKTYRETMSYRNADDVINALDGENPFPASFVITLNNPEEVADVAQNLIADKDFAEICDDPDEVASSVHYGKETAERLFSVTYYIRIITIALVILLVFVAFVFINNTIRLAISARRREIAIERLVGASNSFIRGPFAIEAALEALLGALLAIGVLTLGIVFALPQAAKALPFFNFTIPQTVIVSTYIILIVVGVLLGLLGSAIAMRRYLKI